MLKIFCYILLVFIPICSAKQIIGVDNRQLLTESGKKAYIVEVNPQLVKIQAVRAKDQFCTRSSVADLAKSNKAIAAINGGFFRVKNGKGIPAGAFKINNQIYGIAYQTRAAIGWDPEHNITLVDRIKTKTTVTTKQAVLPVTGMNIPFTANNSIIYTDNYNNKLNLAEDATLITISHNSIVADLKHASTIPIGENSYIYAVGDNVAHKLPELKVGDPIIINSIIKPNLDPSTTEIWNALPNVISGAPLLIKDEKIITDYEVEKVTDDFINGNHARTAIGILANGNWLLVVTEPITINELVKFLYQQGCTNSINLDGGSSSMMYYNGQLFNPNFLDNNQVTDAILVLAKEALS